MLEGYGERFTCRCQVLIVHYRIPLLEDYGEVHMLLMVYYRVLLKMRDCDVTCCFMLHNSHGNIQLQVSEITNKRRSITRDKHVRSYCVSCQFGYGPYHSQVWR